MEEKIELGTGTPVWAIGVMTGTSMDGVDIALLKTDGETIAEFGPTLADEIPDYWRRHIAEAMKNAVNVSTEVLADPDQWPDWLWSADFGVSLSIMAAAKRFVSVLDQDAVDSAHAGQIEYAEHPAVSQDLAKAVAGIHGQTIIHRPEEGFTLQVGGQAWVRDPDPGSEASEVSCVEKTEGARPTQFFHPKTTQVSDFRIADMAAGGQGAPLAPFYHFALVRHIGATEPLAFLNIGGVGNVTWVDPRHERPEDPGALIAFDTGPGNALVNDWMQAETGDVLDRDGAAAAQGRVHRDRLSSNSGQAYLDRRPPKSLDRNDFHGVLAAMERLSTEDGAATLTAFTADTVAQALRHMPSPPSRWLVCGGGRKNQTMMRMLADRLNAPVDPVEAVGLDGDMLEAQAFAYLAVRVLRGLPTSAPSTTGCREPISGGRVIYPG